jgi:hypothetical protein
VAVVAIQLDDRGAADAILQGWPGWEPDLGQWAERGILCSGILSRRYEVQWARYPAAAGTSIHCK